jgi:hypothetical protein
MDKPRFEPQQEQEIFIFPWSLKPNARSIYPPINKNWDSFQAAKSPGREANQPTVCGAELSSKVYDFMSYTGITSPILT